MGVPVRLRLRAPIQTPRLVLLNEGFFVFKLSIKKYIILLILWLFDASKHVTRKDTRAWRITLFLGE